MIAMFARHALDPETLGCLQSVANVIAIGIQRRQVEDERIELLSRERAARREAELSAVSWRAPTTI